MHAHTLVEKYNRSILVEIVLARDRLHFDLSSWRFEHFFRECPRIEVFVASRRPFSSRHFVPAWTAKAWCCLLVVHSFVSRYRFEASLKISTPPFFKQEIKVILLFQASKQLKYSQSYRQIAPSPR
jgi:hypothetical protein